MITFLLTVEMSGMVVFILMPVSTVDMTLDSFAVYVCWIIFFACLIAKQVHINKQCFISPSTKVVSVKNCELT